MKCASVKTLMWTWNSCVVTPTSRRSLTASPKTSPNTNNPAALRPPRSQAKKHPKLSFHPLTEKRVFLQIPHPNRATPLILRIPQVHESSKCRFFEFSKFRISPNNFQEAKLSPHPPSSLVRLVRLVWPVRLVRHPQSPLSRWLFFKKCQFFEKTPLKNLQIQKKAVPLHRN